tara:strand:+ start:628 stop:1314 length:687 start_codon:yes stop_codon:yes gene_type:complete
MYNISVIGNGLIGNCIARTFYNVTLYGRNDSPSEFTHDVLIIAAPGGNRISVESDQDKDMLDCYKLVDTISKCTYKHLIYISSRDVLYNTVYGTNRKVLEEMVLNFDNSVALRIGKALAPGLERNILSDINNNTWLDKINLTNTDQWYPIKRLLLDADSLFTSKNKVDVFLSRPIYNKEIVTRYRPKLIKQLTKNVTKGVQHRDDKHSTGNYIVPDQDIWQIFDTYFI